MFERHAKIKKKLMDIYYKEDQLTDDIKSHLESCEECASYWQSLGRIGEKMYLPEIIQETDEKLIINAFIDAERIGVRNKNIGDFIVFITATMLLMGILIMLGSMGYGKSIIIFQLLFLIFAPLSVPFLIIQRILKEEG